jgi:hypothetical protein
MQHALFDFSLLFHDPYVGKRGKVKIATSSPPFVSILDIIPPKIRPPPTIKLSNVRAVRL